MKAKNENIINKHRHKLQDVIPLSTPYLVFIDPCNMCNFKCDFCAPHKSEKAKNIKQQLMNMDMFKKVIDDLSKFPEKIKMLRIVGQGEPLINKELPDMIKYAKEKNVAEFIEIITNGSLFEPKLNRRIIDSGIDRIRISIEAIDSKGYEEISRAKIDFDKMVENLRDLYNNKKQCEIYLKTVNVVIDTEEKIKKFYDIFGDVCDKIFVENVISEMWSDFEEMNNRIKIEKKEVHGTTSSIKDVKVCPYIFYSFFVNTNGDVTACCADWQRKLIFGNVNNLSLKDIWHGDKMKQFWIDMLQGNRDKYEMCKKCKKPSYDYIDDIDDFADNILRNFNVKDEK